MKKMYTYLQLGLGLLIAWLIPEMGFAQTCDVTPMNISKLATDWTTNCARVATDQCDPTNGPLCSSAANSNWLLLNQNDYCIPKPPCNAVGFSKVEVTMTMEGTWTVKNIGNQSQNTSVGLLGCIKAWVDDMLFDPLEPSAFTGIITLAPNEEKSGALPTRTKTSQYPGDLNDLFAKSCAGTLCVEGLADGFTTLTISNGNLQAVTTVLASLKACVNYQKFTWNVTGTEAACETSADGRVFVNFTPAAGTNTSDYEIRVGNGASWTVSVPATSGVNVVSGLPAGSYTVAVVYKPLANAVLPSDSESCGYCKASVTIAAATATLSCSSTPDCPGGTGDGTVTVNVTGSNLGTVNYLWNNNRTTATITGLTPGNYTVTVTYGPNGKCSKVTTCTVAAAPAVNADISSTNVICNGANNGTITVDPTSGTANYIIAVTGKPNQTSSGEAKVFNNLAPGTYTITVTDANGCIFTGMVTITEPTAVNGTLTPTPAACTGAANGSAIASGSDGTGPYTYNWSRGTVGGGGTTVTGLTPGPISVTITDHNGCTKVLSGTIGTVSEVVITCTPTAERCVDENNGSVSVAVSNAAPNYIASWISGPTQFSQVSLPTSPVVVSNLAPGTYTIRITDNNGCYAECTFTIAEGLDLPCSISGGNSICQGVTENTHSMQTVSGATYAWTLESNTAGASIPGITTNSTVTVNIPSNATGSYTIRMTISKDGCSKTCTKTVSITQPITCTINGPASVCEGSTATFTTSNVTNRVWTVSGGLSFSGQGTTSITVTIPDGTVLSNFTVGLSGTGSNGCPTNCSTTTVINQKPTSAVQALQPVCNLGLPQGAIRATASGVAPFVYRLYKHNPARTLISTSASTASTTYDFTNLGPGTYDVEVTDASNCTSDPSVTVILVVPVAFEPELDCESRNAANIDVVLNITNGTAPFTYSLDNNTFSPVPGNGIITIPFVDGSNQIIYIKDANDCPAISETILLQCCKLAGVCKLTTPAPITGCDRSGIPAAKTNVSDVFDNVTFCEEARLSVETTEAGNLCAGTLSRTYTYTLYDDLNDNNELDDDDVVLEATCAETYVVTAPPVVINCPAANLTIPACTSAADAQILLDNYKALFSFTGGCNAVASFSTVILPNPCVGGVVSIKYKVVSDCQKDSCTKTITRVINPSITLNCADNANITTCRTQAQINSDFSNWLAQFSVTGGCNATGNFDGTPTAPLACGGTTTVTYRVVDAFGCNTQTCTRTFTVTPPALVINCPEANLIIPACTTAESAQTLLANYKALFSFSGGCNAQASFSNVTLPDPCVGGTVSITYTVVSDCDTKACTKSISRTINPPITLTCADNVNITTCKTQTQVNTEFSNWLAQFSVTGGCNATGRFDGEPTAPAACGGTTTVTYRVVDAFGCNTQTCTKTFTVTPPALSISVPEAGLNIPACTSAAAAQTLLNNYKALFSFSGGCNATASFSTVVLPNYCTGGTVSITYTVVSDCDTKSATRSIIRAAEPALSISCPEADLTIPHSLTEAEAKALLDNYKGTFSYHGGCNTTASFSVVTMPDVCLGGETTITYTVTSDCDTKTCTKKIIRIANPVPTVDITVDGPTNFCEKGSTKVIIKTSEQNKPYDIFFTDLVSSVTVDCLPKAVGGAYIIQDDENGIDTIELNNLPAGTYKYVVSNVVDRFGCTSALDLSDTVSITTYPIPVGEDFNKTIYSCLPASVNLPLRVKCNVPSTFTWFSVASVGSSVPYDNPNVAGESFNPAGTSSIITDVLTNLIGTPQTIIYRVVPTSEHNCVGEPFYVTVVISPRANIECLACMTQVRVTLDDKCRKLITPNLVVDGFAECPNRELLQEALEVLIDDGNNDSYVDCAGTYKYVIRIKPEFAECFDYQPCWGTIIAEDKTGPIIECVNWVEKPLDCYDVNYVLNNHRTIGKVGETRSPRPSATGNQIIPNAEGIGEAGTCNLLPPNLVADNIKNLGYVYFRDNCRNCGCRTTVKWNDKVEYYTCEQMRTNGNIYARIYRTWVATDCNGMTADTVQVINFTRPVLSDFVFNGPGDGVKYDRVVTYNACTADRSLIKKEDVTPYTCSFFNAENNPRCLFIDQVECNYSVSIKDTEFPICGGKGLKIDRELYVFDWCAGGIIDTFHILIKIGDFEAPTVDYAHGAPFDVSTGPMDCTAAIPVTVAGIKAAFGVTIKDNCALGNVSVSVYTKDRYVKGILVYEGPDIPFCEIRVPELTARTKAELRGDHDDYQLGACDKELICWEKVDYAVMNGMMVGLPVGKHLLVVDAFDACYNTSTTCFIFDVKDKIAPVMKCDDDLHVTLSNANGYTSGYAQVSAADIDEGSWDNCKLAWIGVRRNVPDACAASFIAKGYDTNGNGKLDALGADNDYSKADGFDLNGDGDISDFGETFIIKGGKLMTPLADFVEFFCCDLTERVTVELWGGDTSGNTNYCWMDLLIEDKVAPTCIAPWDVTIYCDDKNLAQIDDKIASGKIWGDVTITTGNDCAALDTVYSTVKSLKCGAGYIDRIWILTKQTAKGPITITCKQRINLLPVHEYNICFPKDIATDCKTPIIDTVLTDELACDILAVNVSDKRYDASDDECYKIFRTYTVINWCVYDDRCGDPMSEGHVYVVDRATFGNYGKAPLYVLVRDANRDLTEEFYLSKDLIAKNADDIAFKPPYCEANSEFYHSFMYTQIIKVYDSELPVVTGKRDTFCTSPTACTANITKVVTIKDNCTDKVELERQFLMIAPFQTTDAGKMILYSTPRWSVKELGNGQFEISVSNLPEGAHDLIVVGRDECGNLSVATRIPFVVKDCKAPAPICINGLSTELMPDGNGGGMMAVWASDFVASKIYDCNGQGPETSNGLKLVTKYSINRVGSPVVATQTGINLTCADAGKVVLVELHAWDEAGNHDFCVTFVEVQDNRKVCPNPGTVVTGEISGLISTDEAEPVSGVKIDVSGGAQMNQNSTSNGVFNFNNLTLGSDFTVTAQLDKDHLNGVSTFDLVQLQKHILGVKLIDNPYRLIAADVNNSKSISTLDMIQIRKLILNIDQRFNNVPSWRFVDAAYKFPNPSNPWAEAFPEVVNINDLAGKVQANFVAIKMGDVNGSATVSSASTAEVRSSKTLKLSTAEQQLKAGQSYAVAIHAEDLAAVQGFQFTLQVDPAQVQLETIEYNGAMQADHFGFFPQSGQLTSSFVRAPLVGAHSTALSQDLLFTLHLKAEVDGLLSEVLNINSRLTPQEAYNTQDELMNVALEVKDDQISGRAVLHQNTPNPFVEETSIGFYLPEAAEATLTVRDVKGALLYRQEGNFAKGENQILLKHAQLRSSGVLYYTLETADFTASKKMVLINK